MARRTITQLLEELAPLALHGDPDDPVILAAMQALLGELRQELADDVFDLQTPSGATCALLMQRLQDSGSADTAFVVATLIEGLTTLKRILLDADRELDDGQLEMPGAFGDQPRPLSFSIAWWP